MKTILISCFTLLICVICDESKYRLTPRENQIRLGTCGDPLGESLWIAPLYRKEGHDQKVKEEKMNEPKKTTVPPRIETSTNGETETTTEEKTTETEAITETSDSNDFTEKTVTVTDKSIETTPELILTTVKPKPLTSPIITTNAVFISQNHLLVSSSWFIRNLDSTWKWKDNNQTVNDSICKTDKKASFRTEISTGYVLDIHQQWRPVKEIIFLRFCEFQERSEGFLTLISVSRRGFFTVPVVCLPKKIPKDTSKRVEKFGWSNKMEVVNSVKKCRALNSSSWYTLGDTCRKTRGAALVESDSFGIQRLIGVGAQGKQGGPLFKELNFSRNDRAETKLPHDSRKHG